MNKIHLYSEAIGSLFTPDSWMQAKQSDFIFFQSDVDLSEEYEGLPFGRLLGPAAVFVKSAGTSFSFLSSQYSSLTGPSAWASPLSLNRAYFLYHLLRKIGAHNFAMSFLNKLTEKFLYITKPKVIFTIGAPDWLCRTCRNLGIPIIEVLHGRGYVNIPWGWEDREANTLPTQIIAFDETSTRTFSKLSSKGISVIRVRDSWPDFVSTEMPALIPKEFSNKNAAKVVLVTLQWGYSGENGAPKHLSGILPNGVIPEFLLELASDSSLSIKWKFRLHPVQLRGKKYKAHRDLLNYFCSENEFLEWETSSYSPLPQVLSDVTHHITMSSMSVYQVAEFGIPSITLCPSLMPGGNDEHLFDDLVNSGHVQKVGWDATFIRNWLLNESIKPNLEDGEKGMPDLNSIVSNYIKR